MVKERQVRLTYYLGMYRIILHKAKNRPFQIVKLTQTEAETIYYLLSRRLRPKEHKRTEL